MYVCSKVTLMEDHSTGIDAMQDFVYALAASPKFSEDGICFVARRSGLFRSSDRGSTWEDAYKCFDLPAGLPTAAVALSPAFGSDRVVFAGVGGGVLRSTDGGATWDVLMLPTPPPHVTSLALSPDFARDGTVLAGTLEDGVFRSTDRGRSWVAWNFGLLDLNTLALAISGQFAADETLFVATESGIFRSHNGGRAWREVPFPIEFAPVLSVALTPSYATDGTVFAGTEGHGLLVSRDGGQTWGCLGEGTMGGAVNGLVVAPGPAASLDVLAVLGEAVLLSRDGGQKWKAVHVAVEDDVVFTAASAPLGLRQGALLLLGRTDGQVQRVTLA